MVFLSKCLVKFFSENRYWQISNAAAPESSCLRIENRRRRGILRDRFQAGLRISRNPKSSLRPPQNLIRFSAARPQEEIDLLARSKCRNFIHMGAQMSHAS